MKSVLALGLAAGLALAQPAHAGGNPQSIPNLASCERRALLWSGVGASMDISHATDLIRSLCEPEIVEFNEWCGPAYRENHSPAAADAECRRMLMSIVGLGISTLNKRGEIRITDWPPAQVDPNYKPGMLDKQLGGN